MVERRKVRCTYGNFVGKTSNQIKRVDTFKHSFLKRYFKRIVATRRSLDQLPTTDSSTFHFFPILFPRKKRSSSRELIDALSDDKLTHFSVFRTVSSITTGDHRVLLNKHETRGESRLDGVRPRREREREEIVPDRVKTITGTAIRLSSTKSHGVRKPCRRRNDFPSIFKGGISCQLEVTEPSSPSCSRNGREGKRVY